MHSTVFKRKFILYFFLFLSLRMLFLYKWLISAELNEVTSVFIILSIPQNESLIFIWAADYMQWHWCWDRWYAAVCAWVWALIFSIFNLWSFIFGCDVCAKCEFNYHQIGVLLQIFQNGVNLGKTWNLCWGIFPFSVSYLNP